MVELFWYVCFTGEITKRAWFALFDGVLSASLNTRLYIFIEKIVSDFVYFSSFAQYKGVQEAKSHKI